VRVFFLFVHLFNRFYLCVCFPLVCTFVQLFLSVRLSSSCWYLLQEENRRTDKNNWTNVQPRRKHTHR
jgi:hypothetical protein